MGPGSNGTGVVRRGRDVGVCVRGEWGGLGGGGGLGVACAHTEQRP